ncbi:MAG: TetR/AcrR family transcriptional regulator [Chthoniobacterales bacterium]
MKLESETKCKLLRVGMQLIWENSYGSVSVDDICKRAEVKKGSFYHFFPSKSDLVVAALEADWQRKRVYLDQYFSPQTPPLERIEQFFRGGFKAQQEKSQECGKVCGCPTLTLGAELSTQDENIRLKTVEIMDRYVRYLESAIADAIREGVVESGDPRTLALGLFAYFQGLLLQAKVRNDLTPLHIVQSGMLSLLGCDRAVTTV